MNYKFFAVFFLSLFLISCSGTGQKSNSYIPSLESSGSGKVFILRDSGFLGIASVFTVILNGEKIGTLGNKEILTSQTISGKNTVSVKISGLQGIGLNEPMYSFDASMNQDYYFIVNLNPGFFTNKLEIVEVTEGSFNQSR